VTDDVGAEGGFMVKKLSAEFLGTFVLVLGGVGTAVFTAGFPGSGTGIVGVALAFGLTVLCMAYAFGAISGGHFNPAVSLGLWAAGRFDAKGLPGYLGAQVLGGLAGAAVIFATAAGQAGTLGLRAAPRMAAASNGFGAHSPGFYNLGSAIIAEVVATAVFLFIIIGVTDRRAPAGFAPLAIGLALTLVHLLTVPITNASVNPARSIASAAFAGGGWPISQLWVFIVFPIVGALIAGVIYRFVFESD
jgi:aquaporin Z